MAALALPAGAVVAGLKGLASFPVADILAAADAKWSDGAKDLIVAADVAALILDVLVALGVPFAGTVQELLPIAEAILSLIGTFGGSIFDPAVHVMDPRAAGDRNIKDW